MWKQTSSEHLTGELDALVKEFSPEKADEATVKIAEPGRSASRLRTELDRRIS